MVPTYDSWGMRISSQNGKVDEASRRLLLMEQGYFQRIKWILAHRIASVVIGLPQGTASVIDWWTIIGKLSMWW